MSPISLTDVAFCLKNEGCHCYFCELLQGGGGGRATWQGCWLLHSWLDRKSTFFGVNPFFMWKPRAPLRNLCREKRITALHWAVRQLISRLKGRPAVL